MAGSPNIIRYRGRFDFPVPPEVVWSLISQFDQYERWWGWLQGLTVDSRGLGRGSVLQGTVAPPLPYRMRLRVEILDSESPAWIHAAVHGDLEGQAHLSLASDGPGTRAEVVWTIEMMQRPMRLAARVAGPVLRWGHDRVVESTVAGFRARLGQDHGGVSA